MKSDICKINKDGSGLSEILNEVEKNTKKNGLCKKHSLQLRLLAEELVGMLPELLKDCEGEFWLENAYMQYELHVTVSSSLMGAERRENLLALSTSGKNAAAKGIMGKIRSVAESMLAYLSKPEATAYPLFSDMSTNINGGSMFYNDYVWSFNSYVQHIGQAHVTGNEEEEWDELEKSIVAKLADDVIVGIKGREVEIVVKKTFA